MTSIKEHLIMWLVLTLIGGLLFGLLYSIHSYLPREVRYDCRLAEISPDILPTAKEACRKLQHK